MCLQTRSAGATAFKQKNVANLKKKKRQVDYFVRQTVNTSTAFRGHNNSMKFRSYILGTTLPFLCAIIALETRVCGIKKRPDE